MSITKSDICKLIKELSAGKASGHDGIDTEHIRLGGPMMVIVITKIFNRAIATAICPKDFKFGLLIPITKPGRKYYTDTNNSDTQWT